MAGRSDTNQQAEEKTTSSRVQRPFRPLLYHESSHLPMCAKLYCLPTVTPLTLQATPSVGTQFQQLISFPILYQYALPRFSVAIANAHRHALQPSLEPSFQSSVHAKRACCNLTCLAAPCCREDVKCTSINFVPSFIPVCTRAFYQFEQHLQPDQSPTWRRPRLAHADVDICSLAVSSRTLTAETFSNFKG